MAVQESSLTSAIKHSLSSLRDDSSFNVPSACALGGWIWGAFFTNMTALTNSPLIAYADDTFTSSYNRRLYIQTDAKVYTLLWAIYTHRLKLISDPATCLDSTIAIKTRRKGMHSNVIRSIFPKCKKLCIFSATGTFTIILPCHRWLLGAVSDIPKRNTHASCPQLLLGRWNPHTRIKVDKQPNFNSHF